MYIFQLKKFHDVLVINHQTGNTGVLTPQGSVYDTFATSDAKNMSSAYSALFDDNWREATASEKLSFLKRNHLSVIRLVSDNTVKKKPHLHLVANND
jgi:hypothetical protein